MCITQQEEWLQWLTLGVVAAGGVGKEDRPRLFAGDEHRAAVQSKHALRGLLGAAGVEWDGGDVVEAVLRAARVAWAKRVAWRLVVEEFGVVCWPSGSSEQVARKLVALLPAEIVAREGLEEWS